MSGLVTVNQMIVIILHWLTSLHFTRRSPPGEGGWFINLLEEDQVFFESHKCGTLHLNVQSFCALCAQIKNDILAHFAF